MLLSGTSSPATRKSEQDGPSLGRGTFKNGSRQAHVRGRNIEAGPCSWDRAREASSYRVEEGQRHRFAAADALRLAVFEGDPPAAVHNSHTTTSETELFQFEFENE
ncbi:hypothetical protein PG988_011552 [Apiospora saccharicola]